MWPQLFMLDLLSAAMLLPVMLAAYRCTFAVIIC